MALTVTQRIQLFNAWASFLAWVGGGVALITGISAAIVMGWLSSQLLWFWDALGLFGAACIGFCAWICASAAVVISRPTLRTWREKVGIGLIAVATVMFFVGVVLVIKDRIPAVAAGTATAAPTMGSPGVTAQSSVLQHSRFYSTKNKEEVAAFLDKISDKLNQPGEDIFLLAQQALGGYLFNRPEAAPAYLQHLDQIKADVAQMDAFLYDDLLGHEREYRQEMNAILFPKDPLVKFRTAVDDYRTGLSTWIKMRDNLQDDGARQDLQQLVMVSQKSFVAARDELLTWVSRRQELIRQTRNALRS